MASRQDTSEREIGERDNFQKKGTLPMESQSAVQNPKRHGEDWRIGEAALIYVVKKSPEAKRKLADLLQRKETAIDWAWPLPMRSAAFGGKLKKLPRHEGWA